MDPSHIVPPAPASSNEPVQPASTMMAQPYIMAYPYGATMAYYPAPMAYAGYAPMATGYPTPSESRRGSRRSYSGNGMPGDDGSMNGYNDRGPRPKRRRDYDNSVPPGEMKLDPRARDPNRMKAYHDLDSAPDGGASDIVLSY